MTAYLVLLRRNRAGVSTSDELERFFYIKNSLAYFFLLAEAVGS